MLELKGEVDKRVNRSLSQRNELSIPDMRRNKSAQNLQEVAFLP